MTDNARPRVGLFVTCLVDLLRPSIGFAAARLIENAGCEVIVPKSQTCCGQPAYNLGDRDSALALARQTIAAFDHCDYVVAPSGSCAGMLKLHYKKLLDGNDEEQHQAQAFAERVYELTSFLVDVRQYSKLNSKLHQRVTYHDACAGLRELKIRQQPRRLLESVNGLDFVELPESDTCCGFGGTFSTSYPEISCAILDKKIARITETGADLLLSGDLGCLMHIAGRLKRLNAPVQCRHVAEVLAAELTEPPIASGDEERGERGNG